MADNLKSVVRALLATLRSGSSQRGRQAAQLASDLFSLAVESVSDAELGTISYACHVPIKWFTIVGLLSNHYTFYRSAHPLSYHCYMFLRSTQL